MDRWVWCPPIGSGVKRVGKKKNCERGAACPEQLGKINFTRVGHFSCYSQTLMLPLGVPPMLALACSTQNLSQDRQVWRVLTATDVGNVTPGQGVLDHQVLRISGAQHVLAFCQLVQGFTAHAGCSEGFSSQQPAAGSGAQAVLCSGCLSHQGPTVGPRQRCSGCLSYQGAAVGPRQCIAVGICHTKALHSGLGSTLQWVCVLPRPCRGTQAVWCSRFCPTKALRWGGPPWAGGGGIWPSRGDGCTGHALLGKYTAFTPQRDPHRKLAPNSNMGTEKTAGKWASDQVCSKT